MSRNYEKQCPICHKGTIKIQSERTGEPGFRMTDFNFVETTCDCITWKSESVAIKIIEGASGEEVLTAMKDAEEFINRVIS